MNTKMSSVTTRRDFAVHLGDLVSRTSRMWEALHRTLTSINVFLLGIATSRGGPYRTLRELA